MDGALATPSSLASKDPDGQFIRESELNVLVQCRDFFDRESIAALADGLAAQGLISSIHVARFDRPALERYLDLLARLYRSTVVIEDLVSHVHPDGHDAWYVLVAGERRTRAHRHLWHAGCTECQERAARKKRRLALGECYLSHRELKKPDGAQELYIRAVVEENPDRYKALYKQLAENTHERVHPAREANVYAKLYRLLKSEFPKMTMAAFARRVGRSPQAIANALRYAELPDAVQRLVQETKALSYLAAIELTRLLSLKQPAGEGEEGAPLYDADRLNAAAEYIISKNFDLARVKSYVRDRIAATKQTSFLGQVSQTDIDRATSRMLYCAAVQGLTKTMEVCRRARAVQDLRPERRLSRLKKVIHDRALAVQELVDQLIETQEAATALDRTGIDLYAKALVAELRVLQQEVGEHLPPEDALHVERVIARLGELRPQLVSAPVEPPPLTLACA